MAWVDNTIMFWYEDNQVPGRNVVGGAGWRKISDHGRSSLQESVERIENKQRMADGTMRRYTVAKKRTWTASWDNLPSTNKYPQGFTTADGGFAGEDMDEFHDAHNGSFQMQLRRGDGTVETVTVMISDFSKEVVKRGQLVDLWNVSVTLEEV